jgi:leucyl aminopeptidase (aminopeptidase T)
VGEKIFFSDLLERSDIIIALTQYSATAPLKITATEYAFRAASMPGFCSAMLPALRIDLRSILKFCQILQKKLDSANAAKVRFLVEQKMRYEMFFDLRYRSSHVSAGYFPEIGMAGNLPSGETFIVPYEGEKEGESQTHGILPIQYNDTVVYYHINRNRARHVEGNSNIAFQEKAKLLNEPAYGNISELGFGVLSNFGIEPVGKILLDEKLGFHVAFGRSEHFGGFVGMQQFSSPKSAAHIDHIYIPQTQPKVEIEFVELFYGQNRSEKIFKKNRYTIFE